MTSAKYIGMDVHKETISIAVMNAAGKFVMECIIETKASTVLRTTERQRQEVEDFEDYVVVRPRGCRAQARSR